MKIIAKKIQIKKYFEKKFSNIVEILKLHVMKLKIKLTPEQLASVIEQKKSIAQKNYESEIAAAKNRLDNQIAAIEFSYHNYETSIDFPDEEFGAVVKTTRLKWTDEDEKKLIELYKKGKRGKDIGLALSRPMDSVNAKITALKKSKTI